MFITKLHSATFPQSGKSKFSTRKITSAQAPCYELLAAGGMNAREGIFELKEIGNRAQRKSDTPILTNESACPERHRAFRNGARKKFWPLIPRYLAVSRELSSQCIAKKRFAAKSESAKWVFEFWRTRSKYCRRLTLRAGVPLSRGCSSASVRRIGAICCCIKASGKEISSHQKLQ